MNYTTLEQSRKLLELGLNPETADMTILHEEPYETSDSKFNGIHEILCVPFRKYDKPFRQKYRNISYFPAWSLGALIELMPKICEDENDGGCYPTLCKGFNTDMWHCVYRSTLHITDWYKSPIDAAFEMVVWLIENNYIKTEKK